MNKPLKAPTTWVPIPGPAYSPIMPELHAATCIILREAHYTCSANNQARCKGAYGMNSDLCHNSAETEASHSGTMCHKECATILSYTEQPCTVDW